MHRSIVLTVNRVTARVSASRLTAQLRAAGGQRTVRVRASSVAGAQLAPPSVATGAINFRSTDQPAAGALASQRSASLLHRLWPASAARHHTLALDQVAIAAARTVHRSASLLHVASSGGRSVHQNCGLASGVQAAVSAAHRSASLAVRCAAAAAARHSAMSLAAESASGLRVASHVETWDPWPVVKSVWTPSAAVCLGNDDNHAGEPLRVSGSVTSPARSYLAWDVSRIELPAGHVIQAAALLLSWRSGPLAYQASNVNIFAIADADEGWDPSQVRCRDNPDPAGTLQTVTWPAGAAGEQTIALNAAATARITQRLGSGFVTLGLAAGLGNLADRRLDNAGALAPALQLTFKHV